MKEEVDAHLFQGVTEEIERLVRNRFGSAVDSVETDVTETAFGELTLTVTIRIDLQHFTRNLTSRFFGLTSQVRHAMDAEAALRDVFPVILPVAAHAHA